jgi:hypothetical protein
VEPAFAGDRSGIEDDVTGWTIMRWYDKLPLRLRSLFRKPQVEQDLKDEFQFHLHS